MKEMNVVALPVHVRVFHVPAEKKAAVLDI